MLYVQQSLGPDEELVHIGKFHWMYTVNAFMAIVWGVVASIFVLVGAILIYNQMGWFGPGVDSFLQQIRAVHPAVRIFSFILFVLGLLSFAQMMVIKATTEIAITNNRLIYKRGLIARQVGEISIDRIEGVNVLQSILGRLLNYGRLAIRGMGIGEVVLPPIDESTIANRVVGT